MDREKTLEALEQISDRHIEEAARPPKKKRSAWISAVAAILAVAICLGIFFGPARIDVQAVALPGEARIMDRPDSSNFDDREAYLEAKERYEAEKALRINGRKAALANLTDFFTRGTGEFLSGGTENRLWSPVNAYIGLAMVAELTAGESRQQILDLFGAADLEELRQQVSAVWESAYSGGKNEICTLANSLWLEEGLQYNQQTMDALAHHYYASVYQGDLGSDAINKAIGAWLDENTGGFLRKQTGNIRLSQETVLALYSTIYFQAKWMNQFSAKNNTQDVFHGAKGDLQATYMNKKEAMMYYYWGDTFSAVALNLKNGSSMWFILPDEGLTTADVLADGQYMEMILDAGWENQKYMKVNLSVPKFDVSGTMNLQEGLKKLGVADVFSAQDADFSGITSQVPVYLTAANQSVRVQIDEEGVKAAAYMEFPGAMSPAPPDEIIDFIVDKPFLFVIEQDNIPLFAGCVNDP